MSTFMALVPTPAPIGGGLTGAIAAEWTKFWSVRSTWWCVVGGVVLMGLLSAQLSIGVVYDNTNENATDDPGVTIVSDIAVSSMMMVQFVVIALAMLVITSEYSTGSIRSTLQWVPVRWHVLLAKTAIVAPVTFVIGCLLAIVGTLVAAPLLGEWGEYGSGAVVADVLSIGLYLALASVFTAGIGAVVRSAVGTLTTVFMLLMVLPLSLSAAGGELAAKAGAVLPGGAGINFLNGVTDPFSPAVSVGILAGWTVMTLAAGIRFLNARDV